MGWTHSYYIGCNIGISVGLIVILMIIVLSTFYSSNEGQRFVNEIIIGIDPPKLEDEKTKNAHSIIGCGDCKLSRNGWIGLLFCLLGIMTLSITAILIFQGCILANARVIPDGDCPEFEMDCFIFNGTSSSSPINQSASFHCFPKNKTQFPSNLQDATGWCYGWIFRFQSTKSVLDQLGVCSGLIGLFTGILAIIVYLGRCIKTLILCPSLIICCVAACVLLPVFKWSFAPLSYSVLSLGIILGAFGVILYCISPEPEEQEENKQTNATNENQSDIFPEPVSKASPLVTNITSQDTQILSLRSSKVSPK
ncbi:hypothetical protein I4U23_017304 [Adineta vaga]|nr:hypothetical protein I4U23_017304 [Adineta vaga]